jgi:hypothetical protein
LQYNLGVSAVFQERKESINARFSVTGDSLTEIKEFSDSLEDISLLVGSMARENAENADE